MIYGERKKVPHTYDPSTQVFSLCCSQMRKPLRLNKRAECHAPLSLCSQREIKNTTKCESQDQFLKYNHR